MKKLTQQKRAELQARMETLTVNLSTLTAKNDRSAEESEELVASQSEQALITAQLQADDAIIAKEALEGIVAENRKAKAAAAVADAVKRGAIATKDNDLQAKWTRLCTESDDNIAILSAMKGSSALQVAPRYIVQDVRISRESSQSVLKYMDELNAKNISERRGNKKFTAAAKLVIAKEFADLYAKEILVRLKEGDDLPLLDALQSFGTLAQTLVSTRTLELLTLTFPMIAAVFTDLSDQIVNYGDTVNTHIIGIPSVVSYNQSTGWSASDQNDTDVPITYNQYKGTVLTIDAQTISSTVRNLFEETAPAQSYALGKDMVDYLYTKITLAAFVTGLTDLAGNARVALQAGLATFGTSVLVDLSGLLDDAGNPDPGRSIVLARPYFSALEKDLIKNGVYQQFQAAAVLQGNLPDALSGLKPIKAVNLPATAIAGYGNLKGFAFGRSALVLASKLSADYMNAMPGAGNGNLQVIRTPAGFAANQVQYVDNKLGTANQRLEVIYGAAAGQGNAGQILTDV